MCLPVCLVVTSCRGAGHCSRQTLGVLVQWWQMVLVRAGYDVWLCWSGDQTVLGTECLFGAIDQQCCGGRHSFLGALGDQPKTVLW